MGTTARGYRYPEPTELLGNAHAHIKNLATDVDADAAATIAALNAETAAAYFTGTGGTGVDIADGAAAVIGFTPTAEAGWAWSTDRAVYTGPGRLAMITASVAVGLNAPPGDAFRSTARILVNGGFVAAESDHYLHLTTVDPTIGHIATHSLTGLVGFNSGDYVQVEVTNTNGFGETQRVQSVRFLNIAGLALL